ncbi:MAG TPA: head GIN domain-containing protein [Burkholderiaceae bacterium]|nr:head GIN domain-containing protein [Burkholderiaceae bacterium]
MSLALTLPRLALAAILLTAAHLAAAQTVVLETNEEKTATGTRTTISINGLSWWGGGTRVEGNGKVVEKAREISAFSQVKVRGPMDVRLRASDKEALVVRADENIEPLIETRMEGDALVIGLKNNVSINTRSPLEVTLNFRKLEAVGLSGSGNVSVDRIEGPRFAASIAGSGDLRVETANVTDFRGAVSGSGDLRVNGRAENQHFSVAGSGDIWAGRLNGRNVKVSIAGSGDVRLGQCETLDVSIAGSGDVSYQGSPAVKKSIAGSGSVVAAK